MGETQGRRFNAQTSGLQNREWGSNFRPRQTPRPVGSWQGRNMDKVKQWVHDTKDYVNDLQRFRV